MTLHAICRTIEKRILNVVKPVRKSPNAAFSLSNPSAGRPREENHGFRPSSREFPACPG